MLLIISSCGGNDVFYQFEAVPASGWHQDSTIHFDVNIADTVSRYNVYVNVRNRGEYPHQNLWLFIEQQSPDSTVLIDSINFYLELCRHVQVLQSLVLHTHKHQIGGSISLTFLV